MKDHYRAALEVERLVRDCALSRALVRTDLDLQARLARAPTDELNVRDAAGQGLGSIVPIKTIALLIASNVGLISGIAAIGLGTPRLQYESRLSATDVFDESSIPTDFKLPSSDKLQNSNLADSETPVPPVEPVTPTDFSPRPPQDLRVE